MLNFFKLPIHSCLLLSFNVVNDSSSFIVINGLYLFFKSNLFRIVKVILLKLLLDLLNLLKLIQFHPLRNFIEFPLISSLII